MCRILLCVLLLATVCNGYAQFADTAFVTASVQFAKKLHRSRVQGESLLYNGSDYREYRPLKDEHPFYLSDDWVLGSVTYDGQFYDQVYLQLDIEKDQLVIENFNFGTQVQLVKNRVAAFTLGDRRFVQLSDSSVPGGFYEILYPGNTRVVAKRIKQMQERVSTNEITREFEEKNKYYLWFEGKYVGVRNKKSALKVMHLYKKQLLQEFQNKNLNTKNQTELQLTLLAELYDSLPK